MISVLDHRRDAWLKATTPGSRMDIESLVIDEFIHEESICDPKYYDQIRNRTTPQSVF